MVSKDPGLAELTGALSFEYGSASNVGRGWPLLFHLPIITRARSRPPCPSDSETPLLSSLLKPLLIVTLLGAGSSAAGPARTADLALHGGKIVTVDDDIQQAEALAVSGDTILAVGGNVYIRAFIELWQDCCREALLQPSVCSQIHNSVTSRNQVWVVWERFSCDLRPRVYRHLARHSPSLSLVMPRLSSADGVLASAMDRGLLSPAHHAGHLSPYPGASIPPPRARKAPAVPSPRPAS